jgi:hypothetical protein
VQLLGTAVFITAGIPVAQCMPTFGGLNVRTNRQTDPQERSYKKNEAARYVRKVPGKNTGIDSFDK